MPRAFVVWEVRTFTKVVAAFAVALFAFGLWASSAWAQANTDPKLSITKEGPAAVEPGQRFTYALTVANAEDADDAIGVIVTDELPQGVDFVDFEASASTVCEASDDNGRDNVKCTLADLGGGEQERITLVVTAPSDVGDIENRATVVSGETEPENSNGVTTRVLPRLEIVKQDDPDRAGMEDLILYTLRVQNEGNTEVRGVAVTDDLPLDQVDFVALDSSDFRCEYTAGLVQCNLRGSLSPGEVAKVEIVVEPEETGTIQNTGAVFACGDRCILVGTDREETTVEGDGGTTTGGTDGSTTTGSTDGGTTTGSTDGGTTTGGTDGGTTTGGTDDGTTTGGTDGEASPTADAEEDVIVGTVPETDELPITGGPSLFALGAGLVLVAGVASLIRFRR